MKLEEPTRTHRPPKRAWRYIGPTLVCRPPPTREIHGRRKFRHHVGRPPSLGICGPGRKVRLFNRVRPPKTYNRHPPTGQCCNSRTRSVDSHLFRSAVVEPPRPRARECSNRGARPQPSWTLPPPEAISPPNVASLAMASFSLDKRSGITRGVPVTRQTNTPASSTSRFRISRSDENSVKGRDCGEVPLAEGPGPAHLTNKPSEGKKTTSTASPP